MLRRVFRLLVLLLVAAPVVMTMADFGAPSLPNGAAVLLVGDTAASDDAPRLTRLGNETDDLREVVFGPNPRFESVRPMRAAFAPSPADRIESLRDPPPDRPPRAVA